MRRRLTPEQEAARHANDLGRKRREAKTCVTVTWLDPPVVVGRLRIVGVCSDASPETKAMYL